MSKKILKRSLALGALMAFVITGQAWAADLIVVSGETKSNESVINVGTGTFNNAGTVIAQDSITVDGGTFKNTGKIETGTLTISLNTANQSVFGGEIIATNKIWYKGAAHTAGFNLTSVMETPEFHMLGNDSHFDTLKVSDGSIFNNVQNTIIEGAGTRTSLVVSSGSDVTFKNKVTLAGTGDTRIEVENGAKVTINELVSEAGGGKIQCNQNNSSAVVKNICVEENSSLSFQTWSNSSSDSVTYEVENIVLKNGATLKTAIEPGWSSAKIVGDNINVELADGATADFGANGHVNWSTDKINVDADSMSIKFTGEDATSAKVFISANSDLIEEKKEIKVTATGASNTGNANDDLENLANMVKVTSDVENNAGIAPEVSAATGVKLAQEASSIYDGAEGTVQADGTAKVENIIKNSNTYGITENNALSLMTWRAEINDMNKRMGELRNAEGQHGVWARMVRGEAEYESVKNQYNQYQLGYDEKLSTDPSWTVGVAINYTEGDTSYSTGSAENKHVGFSVYGSKLNADGSFIDLIAKYARLENDFETTIGNGDYSSNGYSVSAEYGKRFTQESGMWIEPQVELTYGKVGSADYKMGSIDVAQDSIESLVGRVGFSLGKNISKGNVYARASYLYDFDGETAVNFVDGGKPRTMEQDLGGGWWEVGVGANINLSKATYIYADIEKAFGGEVDTNWQWNLGVRYSF